MSFLLDTNVCIALINGNSENIRKRFDRALKAKNEVFISSIATFEMWFGVFRSSRIGSNADRLEAFLAGPFSILPFDDDDARSAGLINAELKAAGKPIGSYDILIAGQAVDKRLTLVTSNISEFSQVKRLVCHDWGAEQN